MGNMDIRPLSTCILVLALGVALLSAHKLWRISERENRENRLYEALRGASYPRTQPERTRTPPWYQRLGTRIAATRIIGSAKQRSLLAALLAAGINGHGHLAGLIAGKVCAGIVLVPVCWMVLESCRLFVNVPTVRLAVLVGTFILGWRCPEFI